MNEYYKASHGVTPSHGSLESQWSQESIEFYTNWLSISPYKHNHWDLVSTGNFPGKDYQCMRNYSLTLKYYKEVKKYIKRKASMNIFPGNYNNVGKISSFNNIIKTVSKLCPKHKLNQYAINLAPIYQYHHQLSQGDM